MMSLSKKECEDMLMPDGTLAEEYHLTKWRKYKNGTKEDRNY